MSKNKIADRKKDHLELCISGKVEFSERTTGFEKYSFEHYAPTEIDIKKIDLSGEFYGNKIDFPFMISSMTGGTKKAERINEKLAVVSEELNIPLCLGSQRHALEEKNNYYSYRVVKDVAKNIPIVGNIGAAQVAKSKDPADLFNKIINMVNARAIIVHLNPLQELIQPEGETDFSGLMKNLELVCKKIDVPVIAKEVGSGISKTAARKLLETGVRGIDVAGAGGTSWAAVEQLRSNQKDLYFREWGLSTSYCIRTVNELKKEYSFTLIGSGGINNGIDIAKSIALGADLTASARTILVELMKKDVDGTIDLIKSWFMTVKKIMYLTGSDSIKKLKKVPLIREKEMY